MKIAITADLHLTSRERHPERYHALENILDQLVDQKITTLIIAGDLFDASCTTPGEFEESFRNKKYSNIDVIIIPGNHDPAISEGTFSLPNIKFLIKPQMVEIVEGIPFVFVPYQHDASMGEILAESKLTDGLDSWVLVGHGDWLAGMQIGNQYEIGTYMPLSGRDLLLYKPQKVFLGHIHSQSDSSIVHYIGSPCAIDPTETGYRTYLVFDSHDWKVSRIIVDTDYIYFNEQITIIPVDSEESYLISELNSRMMKWKVNPTHKGKIHVRVKVKGYSKNRTELVKVIRKLFEPYKFTDDQQPDVSQVKLTSNQNLNKITDLLINKINEMNLHPSVDEASQDEILYEAMNIIYGGK